MKPTYFISSYQFPVVGDVLTTRQIEQKTQHISCVELWRIDASAPTVITFNAWVKRGDVITAYDLNGSPRYEFTIREVFTDRYVVDETTWV